MSPARSSLLLTGATGFVGGACLRRALNFDGEIHAVTRTGRGPFADRVQWHSADLRDPGEARRIVAEIGPTHCLHSAWIATPGVYLESEDNRSWLEGGAALVDAFGAAGGERFVGVGSCAEYDWAADSFTEDRTPIVPSSLYGRCKASLWTILRAASARHAFSAAWGRVFFPYGPGDAAGRLIPSVIRTLRGGEALETTDGLQERDLIFVDDVADLLVGLVECRHEGAFNVGTGEAVSVRSVVTSLADKVGGLTRIRFGAKPRSPQEPDWLVANMDKVRLVLGWSPSWSLQLGLDACLAAMAEKSHTSAGTG